MGKNNYKTLKPRKQQKTQRHVKVLKVWRRGARPLLTLKVEGAKVPELSQEVVALWDER